MYYRNYYYEQIYPVSDCQPDCLFYQVTKDWKEWFFVKARPSSSPKIKAYHTRFQHELEVMKTLRCGCIPKYYHANSLNHTYILMEYVKGMSLSRYLSQYCSTSTPCQILSRKDMRVICRQVYDTLLYLNENGILYLDLTPENIILTDNRFHLKLVDFTSCFFKHRPLNSFVKASSIHLELNLPTDYLLTQLFALFCARLFYRDRTDFNNHYSYLNFVQSSASSSYGMLFKYGLHPERGDSNHSSFHNWYQWLYSLLAQ